MTVYRRHYPVLFGSCKTSVSLVCLVIFCSYHSRGRIPPLTANQLTDLEVGLHIHKQPDASNGDENLVNARLLVSRRCFRPSRCSSEKYSAGVGRERRVRRRRSGSSSSRERSTAAGASGTHTGFCARRTLGSFFFACCQWSTSFNLITKVSLLQTTSECQVFLAWPGVAVGRAGPPFFK